MATVRHAFAETPFPRDLPWPSISVIVCSYNGARTIRECFEGLERIDYPHFEVIVVDDGSTDRTAEIAREYPFRLIRTENRGLTETLDRAWHVLLRLPRGELALLPPALLAERGA